MIAKVQWSRYRRACLVISLVHSSGSDASLRAFVIISIEAGGMSRDFLKLGPENSPKLLLVPLRVQSRVSGCQGRRFRGRMGTFARPMEGVLCLASAPA